MTIPPLVGVILINYRDYAKRFLADCRDSLRRLDYPRDRYRIYIVDNATSPETQALLAAEYPEAIIIPEVTNAGWGGGNNVGVARAFADGCDDLVFLNMDVVVHPQWLTELVAAAATETRIGIVQSNILLQTSDAARRVNSTGNVFHFLGFGYAEGNGELAVDRAEEERIRDIGYASGSSLFIRGSTFRALGPFDPDFFMYHDDIELCLRARLAGVRVVIAPRSIMWHKYEFSRSVQQVYYMERNRLLTVLEFYRIPTLLLLAPAFLFMECGVFVGSIFGGYARAKFRGWVYFLRPSTWTRIRQTRARLRELRTISDRELLGSATGWILFQEVLNPLLRYVGNPLLAGYWWVARRLLWW